MTNLSQVLNRSRLKDKTLGSLFGVYIGDALGLPVETMSPFEIRHAFGYVNEYIQNKNHKFPSVGKRAPGTISDDSQLTLALMDSINRRQGYDVTDIATAHVEAYDGKWGKPVGWGGSTREAVENVRKKKFPTFSPLGAGNGTCMKVAPMAIYCVYKTLSTPHGRFTNSFNASLLKKCREITLISHGNPMCIVATYCQSRMIIRAMQDELPKTSKSIAKLFIGDAEYAEERLGTIGWHDDKRLSKRLSEILNGFPECAEDGYPISAHPPIIEPLDMNTPDVSRLICTERSSFIYNSYPLVAYCVVKYAPFRNFQYAVTETVNAGADADSNASMVGAIMGACLGFHQIPPELIRGLRKYSMLVAETKKFEMSL